jgi:hypothetical protein
MSVATLDQSQVKAIESIIRMKMNDGYTEATAVQWAWQFETIMLNEAKKRGEDRQVAIYRAYLNYLVERGCE